MDVGDLILISVDDHVIEPPTMFDAHIPERYRDAAPRIEKQPGAATCGSSRTATPPTSGSTR